ncbi:MAG: 3'-5' exonuclease [Methylomicrobium sp.]|nr:3'-5' exonuclease [Methylomicrobium sp.]
MKLKIIGADIETTGLDQVKGNKIIEIALLKALYDTDTHKVEWVGKYVQEFNPDRPIDAKAQAVHGKSIDDLAGCPLWEEKAEIVSKILGDCDLFVAHNVDFDAGFIVGELLRVGINPKDVETFCTMQSGRFATWDGSVPNLRRLCESLNVDYDLSKAHGAEYDIAVTMKCLFIGLRKNLFKIPETLMTRKIT